MGSACIVEPAGAKEADDAGEVQVNGLAGVGPHAPAGHGMAKKEPDYVALFNQSVMCFFKNALRISLRDIPDADQAQFRRCH